MRVVALVLLGSFAMCGLVRPAAAQISPFHLEVAGTVSKFGGPQPLTARSFDMDPDVTGLGSGFHVEASLDIGSRFALAARSGLMRDRESPSASLSFVLPDPIGPVTLTGEFRHKMTLVPTHAILRFRTPVSPGTVVHAEAGIGAIAFTEKIAFEVPGELPALGAAYQTCFSYLVGAGVTRSFYRNLGVTAKFDFYQALPDGGDIWSKGDRPQIFASTLGLRYPS